MSARTGSDPFGKRRHQGRVARRMATRTTREVPASLAGLTVGTHGPHVTADNGTVHPGAVIEPPVPSGGGPSALDLAALPAPVLDQWRARWVPSVPDRGR